MKKNKMIVLCAVIAVCSFAAGFLLHQPAQAENKMPDNVSVRINLGELQWYGGGMWHFAGFASDEAALIVRPSGKYSDGAPAAPFNAAAAVPAPATSSGGGSSGSRPSGGGTPSGGGSTPSGGGTTPGDGEDLWSGDIL